MKYLIRSLKYFAQLLIMLALFIFVLVLFHLVGPDINTIFVGGMSSVWKIIGIVAAFAAVYPRFGYARRRIYVNGSFDEALPFIKDEMTQRGYLLEKTEGEDLSFRLTSHVARCARMWEDRITMTRTMNGWEIEGISKDVIRIVNGFNAKTRDQEDV